MDGRLVMSLAKREKHLAVMLGHFWKRRTALSERHEREYGAGHR